ncbi:lysophospholipase [bacterium]|jgi:uncharacterized protein|nr:lysophospholipase [Verrucomicrobiota bacterium]MDA7644774.1 lysophospholipase [bacterium]
MFYPRLIKAIGAVLVLFRVEAAETPNLPFIAPDGIEFRTETVWSEGVRLVAEVFSQEQKGDARLPTIIMCHGWGGEAQHLRSDAQYFARRGYLVVTFDYRGWGASDGRVVVDLALPDQRERGGFSVRVKEVRGW